jgi:hypothetical protein
MIEKTKSTLTAVKEKLGELKSNVWDEEKNEIKNEFKEKSETKISEIMEMMNNYTSLFNQAGYELSSINASLGLPPEISIAFKCMNAISAEEREAVLLKAKESKMASIIIRSLFKASDYSKAIKVGKFNLKTITITLGLIPGIGISLS